MPAAQRSPPTRHELELSEVPRTCFQGVLACPPDRKTEDILRAEVWGALGASWLPCLPLPVWWCSAVRPQAEGGTLTVLLVLVWSCLSLPWLSKAPDVSLRCDPGSSGRSCHSHASCFCARCELGVWKKKKLLFWGVSLCVSILSVVLYKLLLHLLTAGLRGINYLNQLYLRNCLRVVSDTLAL